MCLVKLDVILGNYYQSTKYLKNYIEEDLRRQEMKLNLNSVKLKITTYNMNKGGQTMCPTL